MAENEPWAEEDHWLQAAIALAVLLFIGFVAAAIWILVAPDNTERLTRVQIAAPFGIFGAAAVTFCTVAWRGLVSVRQTGIARQQVRATEENNLALLLQKGAELIGDSTKPAQVAAGLTSLEAVIRGTNDRFAVQAMNLVADLVRSNYAPGGTSDLSRNAITVLRLGEERGHTAERYFAFESESVRTDQADEARRFDHHLIHGVRSIRYRGGVFSNAVIPAPYADYTRFIFHDVWFDRGTLDLAYVTCSRSLIWDASIVSISNGQMRNNKFRDCNFSGALIAIDEFDVPIPDLRGNGNYFAPGNPPIAPVSVNWEEVLLIKEPPVEIPF